MAEIGVNLIFYYFYTIIFKENIWPDGVPSDEVQMERYFSFMPGVPDVYFPMILRFVYIFAFTVCQWLVFIRYT